jgi:membrane protease YdiL (CAAX protease family)
MLVVVLPLTTTRFRSGNPGAAQRRVRRTVRHSRIKPVRATQARTLAEYDDMWRPQSWTLQPANPPVGGWGLEASVAAAMVTANVVGNTIVPDALYVPFNAASAAAALYLARRGGATESDLAIRPDRLGRGAVVGAEATGVIAAVVGAGIALRATRGFFIDERVVAARPHRLFYEAFIRIPFGTALHEEILFRSVAFGTLVRRTSPLTAAAVSSALFGLWHIIPTLQTLPLNPAGAHFESRRARAGAVTGGVVGTGLAGFVFVWLRLRSNSIVAPIMAHIATNSIAYLSAAAVARRAPMRP